MRDVFMNSILYTPLFANYFVEAKKSELVRFETDLVCWIKSRLLDVDWSNADEESLKKCDLRET